MEKINDEIERWVQQVYFYYFKPNTIKSLVVSHLSVLTDTETIILTDVIPSKYKYPEDVSLEEYINELRKK